VAGSIVKNAVIVLGVEQGQVNFKLPNLDKLLKNQDRLNKTLVDQKKRLEEVSREWSDNTKAAQASAEKQVASNKSVQQSQEQLLSQSRALQRGLLEAGTQGGEGLFSLARGFTLLGVSSEDSLRQVFESLKFVQAGFDVFRGGANIYKSYLTVVDLLSAAQVTNTTVTSLNTAATNTNTTAKVANAAASRGMLAAIGPLGAVVAAGTIAIGAAVAIRAALSSEDDKLAKRELALADALRRSNQALRDRSNAASEMRQLSAMSFDGGIEEQQFSIDLERARLENELRRLPSQQDVSRAVAEATRGADGRVDIQAFNEQFGKANSARLERAVEIETRLSSLLSNKIGLEKQATQEAIRLNEARAQEILKQKEGIDLAQKRLETERQAVQGVQGSVGSLDSRDFARLQGIARRKQSGKEIGRRDLQFLQGIKGFGEFAQREFEDLGRERGALKLAGQFGFESGVPEAQRQLAELNKGLSGLTDGKSVAEALAGIKSANEGFIDEFESFRGSFTELIRDMQGDIEELGLQQSKMDAFIQQGVL